MVRRGLPRATRGFACRLGSSERFAPAQRRAGFRHLGILSGGPSLKSSTSLFLVRRLWQEELSRATIVMNCSRFNSGAVKRCRSVVGVPFRTACTARRRSRIHSNSRLRGVASEGGSSCRKKIAENAHHLPDNLDFVGIFQAYRAIKSVGEGAHHELAIVRTAGRADVLAIAPQQDVQRLGP